ncbi:MAG: DUF6179 domain-containing protein [Oscillospiraceae bacterium]|nr:DUF6179 domain-containing protein [Oscillospiraceae bacterium]
MTIREQKDQKEQGYPPEELISLAAELAMRYTGHESTSITYERAQSLMEAVRYCLNEYEKSGRGGLSGLTEGESASGSAKGPLPEKRQLVSAKEAYRCGYQLILGKVSQLREKYNELTACFSDYGMECLRDTVLCGIPEFFKWYDVRFAPQETLLTLDYPILADIRALSGVDAVYAYVSCICLEQKFLGAAGEGYVRKVLYSYARCYQMLEENICSIVLTDMVRHFLIQKPVCGTGLLAEEEESLRECLEGMKREELLRTVRTVIASIAEQLFDGERELQQYLGLEAENIAVRIQAELEGVCS